MGKIIYNSEWAKSNIDMPELLSRFGHEPVKSVHHGREYWYISPFRYEKEPSFHTSYLNGKWIWNDFGRGDVAGRGTVIGFLELHERVDVSGALQILKDLFPHRGKVINPQSLKSLSLFKGYESPAEPKQNAINDKLSILEIKDQIWDKALIGYLAGERKLDHKIAVKYLKHIKYQNLDTGTEYNTLGFENESGDYECRDKYFKGILKAPSAIDRNAAKDISYIPGREKGRVAVFEGFMDFLSILTKKQEDVLKVDAIILNMVNMRRRALDFIKQHNYEQVFTFFDNDSAGEKTTNLFQDELGNIVYPQNHLYQDYKDYNEMLQAS